MFPEYRVALRHGPEKGLRYVIEKRHWFLFIPYYSLIESYNEEMGQFRYNVFDTYEDAYEVIKDLI